MGKPKVLLVDADPTMQRAREVSLRAAGYSVVTAVDVDSALAVAASERPRLLVADTAIAGLEARPFVEAVRAELGDVAVLLLIRGGPEDGEPGELEGTRRIASSTAPSELVAHVAALAPASSDGIGDDAETLSIAKPRYAGAIEEVAVADLVQTFEVSQKSGFITLKRGRVTGTLWFRDGQLWDAEVGVTRGKDAFFRLLLWSEGDFEVQFGDGGRGRSIVKDTGELLGEALRRADVFARLLTELPGLFAILEVDEARCLARASAITPAQGEALARVDGKRTVREVVDACPLDELVTLGALRDLHRERLVVVAGLPGSPSTLRGPEEGGARATSQPDDGGLSPPPSQPSRSRPLPALAPRAAPEPPPERARSKRYIPVAAPRRSRFPLIAPLPNVPVHGTPDTEPILPSEAPSASSVMRGVSMTARGSGLPARVPTATQRISSLPPPPVRRAIAAGDTQRSQGVAPDVQVRPVYAVVPNEVAADEPERASGASSRHAAPESGDAFPVEAARELGEQGESVREAPSDGAVSAARRDGSSGNVASVANATEQDERARPREKASAPLASQLSASASRSGRGVAVFLVAVSLGGAAILLGARSRYRGSHDTADGLALRPAASHASVRAVPSGPAALPAADSTLDRSVVQISRRAAPDESSPARAPGSPSAASEPGTPPAVTALSPPRTASTPSSAAGLATGAVGSSASVAPVASAARPPTPRARALVAEPTGRANAGSLTAAAQKALERDDVRGSHAAVELARRATALDPTNAEAWLTLGAAHQMAGRRGQALEAYRRCASAAASHPRAAECRALLGSE